MAKIFNVFRDLLFEDENKTVKELAVANSANLRGANLGGADLGDANLGGANLGYANLRCADLGYADLGYANLRCADLGYANLGYANLGGANLGGANLRGADLRDANLGYANLGYANLGGANLGGANLGYANLGYADLGYANLGCADLGYAKVDGVKHLEAFKLHLTGLVFDGTYWIGFRTTNPDGTGKWHSNFKQIEGEYFGTDFDPPEKGVCCKGIHIANAYTALTYGGFKSAFQLWRVRVKPEDVLACDGEKARIRGGIFEKCDVPF